MVGARFYYGWADGGGVVRGCFRHFCQADCNNGRLIVALWWELCRSCGRWHAFTRLSWVHVVVGGSKFYRAVFHVIGGGGFLEILKSVAT